MTKGQARQRQQFDIIDPDRARALQAALGDTPSIKAGDVLPPFFHQIYFWDSQPRDSLGADGHPAGSDLIPDLGLPRRMWAAGRVIFHTPLRAGSKAEKITTAQALTRKTGRSGPLAFVTLKHEIKQRQSLALTEYQDIVYRPVDAEAAMPPQAPVDEDDAFDVTFDSTLLFRYSGLTFNGHRIHYDEAYARQVEGYDGLVVHGPLLAHYLMQLAQMKLGTLREFSYRATAPLMHHETATLCWKDGTAWVRGPGGRQCMSAIAR